MICKRDGVLSDTLTGKEDRTPSLPLRASEGKGREGKEGKAEFANIGPGLKSSSDDERFWVGSLGWEENTGAMMFRSRRPCRGRIRDRKEQEETRNGIV